MFNVKRIPKWAWWISGGVIIGVIGYEIMRKRQMAAASTDSTSTTATDSGGAVGYSSTENMPGIVTVPYQPASSGSDPGDLTGVYVSTLESLFNSQGELISQLLEGVTGGGSGSTGSTTATGGVVPVQTPNPQPPPSPKPGPAPLNCAALGMEAGNSAGNCKPAGAVCRHMVKCDSNSEGHYCTWKFHFGDGHSNCYNNYSSGKKAGQCVGPFGC